MTLGYRGVDNTSSDPGSDMLGIRGAGWEYVYTSIWWLREGHADWGIGKDVAALFAYYQRLPQRETPNSFFFGEASGGIWEASERHLRGIGEASGRHLGGIWEASGPKEARKRI